MKKIKENFPENVKGVIQIGASIGDELKLFVNNRIENMILFEPCSKSFTELQKEAENFNKIANITLSDYVVSNKTQDVNFYIGQQEYNSSLLDLNPNRPLIHRYVNNHDRLETKKSITLDEYVEKNNIDMSLYDFIYMDVQGAEHLVLEGARKTLKHIKYIYQEVSFAEIYAGTMMCGDMIKYLFTSGFETEWIDGTYLNNQGDLFSKKLINDSSVLRFLHS